MESSLHATTLRRAADILGSEALQIRLGVSSCVLQAWLAGMQDPPLRVFLRAADVVVDHKVRRVRDGAADAAAVYDR